MMLLPIRDSAFQMAEEVGSMRRIVLMAYFIESFWYLLPQLLWQYKVNLLTLFYITP